MYGYILLFLCVVITIDAKEKLNVIDYGSIVPNCAYENDFFHTGQLAFNSAPEVATFIAYLKNKYSINTVIETGTCKGNTTILFSLLFDRVYTAEISKETYQANIKRFAAFPNICSMLGSSEQVLTEILPQLVNERVLFYLDAHWKKYWPLKDELDEISKTHRDNCIVIVDDVKVPGRRDVPFSKWNGHDCGHEYMKEDLQKVFTNYDVYYIVPRNVKSRGKFVAIPKHWIS